jgi:hypothetical protein
MTVIKIPQNISYCNSTNGAINTCGKVVFHYTFKWLSIVVFSFVLGISAYIASGFFSANVNIKEYKSLYKRKIENLWYSLSHAPIKEVVCHEQMLVEKIAGMFPPKIGLQHSTYQQAQTELRHVNSE